MGKLKIAGATVNQTPLDWAGNVARINGAINKAIEEGVDLLCFPELSVTAYGCEDLFLSEWLPEKAMHALSKIIPECKGISVAVGLPVRLRGKVYNCACVITDGRIQGIIAKQNMAIDGVHYEARWFEPWPFGGVEEINFLGEQTQFGDLVFNVKGYNVGFEICEDAWRMERPAKYWENRGIDIILNPSASHFALEKTFEREDLVISSSEKFDCIYLYANLLGNEAGRMIYDGEILIAQKGTLHAKNDTLNFQDFNVVAWEVDDTNESVIIKKSREEEFAQSVSLALFDYLRKSGLKGFTLSLSGGADSSTTAILVSEMVNRSIMDLGQEIFCRKIGLDPNQLGDESDPRRAIVNTLLGCAYQATENSSQETFDAAQSLAEGIGARFYSWEIDEVVRSYSDIAEKALGIELNWEQHDLAMQNIQARSRSPIIWMLANLTGSVLLTTSNRSEGDVGYATMDGDTSGSLAPIAGIDKHFIRHWLKWAQDELGYECLDKVNNLVPTAELRPKDSDQSDESDLMPYELMVKIERIAIRDRLSPVQVFDNLRAEGAYEELELKKYIHKFFTLWSRNQWKRERLAPSFHLDDFNVDPRTWCRFPILSTAFEEELAELKR